MHELLQVKSNERIENNNFLWSLIFNTVCDLLLPHKRNIKRNGGEHFDFSKQMLLFFGVLTRFCLLRFKIAYLKHPGPGKMSLCYKRSELGVFFGRLILFSKKIFWNLINQINKFYKIIRL